MDSNNMPVNAHTIGDIVDDFLNCHQVGDIPLECLRVEVGGGHFCILARQQGLTGDGFLYGYGRESRIWESTTDINEVGALYRPWFLRAIELQEPMDVALDALRPATNSPDRDYAEGTPS